MIASGGGGRASVIRTKAGAASLSVASNSILIALKLAAGAITGSIAIITEAIHSSIDLLASVIALISVRKADEPPDREHPYGHQRVENLAAAIEGMLILVGAGIIIFEATRRLVNGSHVEDLGVGIAVIAFSAVANLGVSAFLYRRAEALGSPALAGDAAHLSTDALTSLGVLVGLVLAQVTGEAAFDSIAALCVAVAIVWAGISILTRSGQVLIDEAPPPEELDRIEAAIGRERARTPEIAGYHKLRARRAGARSYIDLHLQFRSGTTLEDAHELAHRLRDEIEAQLPGSEVLIHVEPEGSVRAPGETAPLRQG
jgi:cation diffusion facilitator family transporter